MLKTFSGRKASQNEFELNSFCKFLNDKNVKSYLEIGARHGDTFYHVMKTLPKGSIGVAVDLPGGLWGQSKSKSSLISACEALDEEGYNISLILGDSKSKKVIEKIKSFDNFDAILIDGDHTLAGVILDWKNYGSLSNVVAFHDIVGNGEKEKVFNNEVEVPLFFEEERKNFKNVETFIDKDSKMGIGVLIKDEN